MYHLAYCVRIEQSPGHIIGLSQVTPDVGGGQVVDGVRRGAQERGDEVIEQVDGVHHSLGTLDDLAVEGRLDIGLREGEQKMSLLHFPVVFHLQN